MSQPRRVSVRRGSVTAPDPFGSYAALNLNPNRTTSSRLTIVRVVTTPPTPQSPNEQPPSLPVSGRSRFQRGRPSNASQPPERISFAVSSFAGPNARPSSPDQRPPSPSSSPRLRPSSPHLTPTSYPGKPHLTPDQLVDLARQSAVPRRPDVLSPPTAPATFTPLPDDIFLPFIDRPAEVAELISKPPDLKLFTLLAQIFRSKNPKPVPEDPLPEDKAVDLPRDPTKWTYNQLIYHLTRVDRDIAPDFIWSIANRKCIFSHSELLWERIKGALGIPPELDIDYEFLEDDQESPDTSDISDDEGRSAKGHWTDWDAVMDSPVSVPRSKRFSFDSPYQSKRFEIHEPQPRIHTEERLPGLNETIISPSNELEGQATAVPSPRPPEDNEGLLFGSISPLIPPESADYISIEPLIVPSASSPLAHPHIGDGLGDIAEGAEEDETESVAAESTGTAATPVDIPRVGGSSALASSSSSSEAETSSNMISPSDIQGLRISTSPQPPGSYSTPPIMSPMSPLPGFGSVQSQPETQTQGNTQPQPIPGASAGGPSSRAHSRASSFSSIGPFNRSESTGNLAASWSHGAHGVPSGGSSGYAPSVFYGSEAGDSSGYMSDGDRSSGHPIFPSNFARLTGGPTLRANNPTSRHSHGVPHARYVLSGMPRKERAQSQGASSVGSRIGAMKAANRQSWGAAPHGVSQ
ncbi:hypothetical protein CVT26_013222 [Gymnopilus dilepis]|uniref:Uncharacterized protein n=1 Tax=Gymnopilus dilepis TaxID=231916 RepID=A0A409X067_9AGAR|nr:hypothetical protein CVT26_013222 [Gymnopilus dilepis]